MRVDLNLLRVLLAIYDTGSVSGAARHLKMSQPSVSAALSRLRHSFGDPLFIRQATGMSATSRALQIIDKTREVIGLIDLEILRNPTFLPSESTDEFVFSMSALGEIVFLPKLFGKLHAEAPHAHVRTVSLPPEQLEGALCSGEVDMAIGYYPDLKTGDIFQQRLFSHNLACMVRTGHRIRGPRMTLDEFMSAEHAIVKDGGRTQEMFEDVLAAHGIRPNIVLRTSHYMSIPTIIAESDLVVVLPRTVCHAVGDSNRIRMVLPPIEIPAYDLKMFWHRRFQNDPKVQWLRSAAAEIFRDEDFSDDGRSALAQPPIGKTNN